MNNYIDIKLWNIIAHPRPNFNSGLSKPSGMMAIASDWKTWDMIIVSQHKNKYSNDVHVISMMTSSNGNIFRVTGHLCGEFTGPGEFPTQRPVTRRFDVYFDLRLNKRLCKQSWGWWFETLLCPLRVTVMPSNHSLFSPRPSTVMWALSLTVGDLTLIRQLITSEPSGHLCLHAGSWKPVMRYSE